MLLTREGRRTWALYYGGGFFLTGYELGWDRFVRDEDDSVVVGSLGRGWKLIGCQCNRRLVFIDVSCCRVLVQETIGYYHGRGGERGG